MGLEVVIWVSPCHVATRVCRAHNAPKLSARSAQARMRDKGERFRSSPRRSQHEGRRWSG